MKIPCKLFLKIAFLFLFLVGCRENQSNTMGDENGIRSAIQEYQEAYNHQDINKMASLWATDAIYYNPVTGANVQGREEIAEIFKEQFAKNENYQIDIMVNKIAFPSQDMAVQKGVMQIHIPDQPDEQLIYQVALKKENGKWLFNEIDEIEVVQVPSNFEHLKELSWMTGSWEDTDDTVEIHLNFQWDKHKNFLIQKFKMQIFEQETLEGQQIIGWDPDKKLIRSWLFDSDGGFGHGTWENVENNWYVDMSYILNDGSSASSKNIYTYIDENHYTFSSTEREVAGQILPDTDPVNVQKVN